jgi:hypothetical protein
MHVKKDFGIPLTVITPPCLTYDSWNIYLLESIDLKYSHLVARIRLLALMRLSSTWNTMS